MCNGYRVGCPWVQRPGPGVDHPPTSGTGFKERVELWHLYCLFLLSLPLRDRIVPSTSNVFVITCKCTFQNTEQCPAQVCSRSTDQCMSRRLWYRTFHYQVRRSPLWSPLLIRPGKYTPSDVGLLLPFSISGQNSEDVSHPVLLCYMIRPPTSP
jgi:hypothetical protein